MALNLAVMKRDLLEETRRERKYLIRLAFGGVLLIAMVSTILKQDIDRARMAAEMFRGLSFVQFLMLNILAAVLGALAVGVERSRGTLGLLVLSKLTPFEVVFGMWLGRMLAVFSVLACGLPFFAAALSMGGILLEDVGTVFILTAASASLAMAAGIAGATVSRSMNLGLFVSGAILAAVYFIPGTGFPSEMISPYRSMEAALGYGTAEYTTQAAVLSLAAAAILLVISARFIPKAAQKNQAAVLGPILEKIDSLTAAVYPPESAAVIKPKLGNIILNREIMRTAAWRTRHLVKIVAFFWIMFGVLVILEPKSAAIHKAALIALGFAFAFLATYIGALTISREKESGALYLIVITQLTSRQIITGKMLAGMRLAAAGIVIVAGYVFMLYLAGLAPDVSFLAISISLFTALLFFFVQGLLCALLTKSTTRALATAMIVASIEVGTFQFGLTFQFANPYQIATATVPMGEGSEGDIPVPRIASHHVFGDAGSRMVYYAVKAAMVNLITIAIMFLVMEQALEKLMRRHMEQTDVSAESMEYFRRIKKKKQE